MSFSQVIKSISLPKIALKQLSAPDNSLDGEGLFKEADFNKSNKEKYGSISPFIEINGQLVFFDTIEQFILDETGFIPTVSLIFTDTRGVFSSAGFPKDDIIMSVYIKTQNERFKPIRSDFLITSIKTVSSIDNFFPSAVGITYIVKGELNVPKLYNNVSKSYRNLTSKEVLNKIADELELGFAENESSPSDKMTWINHNNNYIDFIKHVIQHAYQDDDSFFTAFIDKYYFLNYLNVNQQLLPGEIQKTLINSINSSQLELNQEMSRNKNTELFDIETPLYLSTHPNNSKKSNFITEYRLISEHGRILKTKGYRKRIYYYDHLSENEDSKNGKFGNKFIDFYVNPISNPSNGLKPLIPKNEDLKNNIINKWINIDYGNTHREWNAARLINQHNLDELNKIKLYCKVNGINFQIIRGSKIPVEIVTTKREYILKYKSKEYISKNIEIDDKILKLRQLDDYELILDEFLSSNYYVDGVKYYYEKGKINSFYTEFFLTKREWKLE